jgi:hypothetical protein
MVQPMTRLTLMAHRMALTMLLCSRYHCGRGREKGDREKNSAGRIDVLSLLKNEQNGGQKMKE